MRVADRSLRNNLTHDHHEDDDGDDDDDDGDNHNDNDHDDAQRRQHIMSMRPHYVYAPL